MWKSDFAWEAPRTHPGGTQQAFIKYKNGVGQNHAKMTPLGLRGGLGSYGKNCGAETKEKPRKDLKPRNLGLGGGFIFDGKTNATYIFQGVLIITFDVLRSKFQSIFSPFTTFSSGILWVH